MTTLATSLALASAVMWGLSDFGAGLMTRRLSALTTVAWTQAFGLVALALALLVTRTPIHLGSWVGWAMFAALAGTSGLAFFYEALATGTMGVVSPIASLGALVPVLIALAGGEHPTAVQLLGMVIALGGVVAASGPELSGEGASPRSVLYAGLSGVCFGFAMYALARAAVTSPLLAVAGMRVTTVAALGLASLVALALGRRAPVGRIPTSWLGWAALVGVGDAGANLAYSYATTKGLISLSVVLGSLYPVFTVLAAVIVLRERMKPVQVVGVALALAGITLVSLS